MRLVIPRLRMWHLLGLVATVAAFLAVRRVQREVDLNQVHVRALQYADASGRLKAAQELASAEGASATGHASVAVEPLIGALRDPDARVRAQVAETLGGLLRADPADQRRGIAKAALTVRLNDRDHRTRTAAGIALADLNGDPTLVIPALAEALHDDDVRIRREATRCLDYFAPYHARARSEILTALRDPDPQVRVMALHVLRFAVLKAKNWPSSPPGLVRELEGHILSANTDADAKVQAAAAAALDSLGIAPARQEALPRD